MMARPRRALAATAIGVILAAAAIAPGFRPMVAANAAPAASAVNVAAIDAAGLKRAVSSRKNKVVVVNFWATWCGACVEEFPSLVALQKKYRAKGMELVTVSFDDTQDLQTKVKPFLNKSGLATGTYINKTGNDLDEAYLRYLEPKLPTDAAVPLPRTYIFARNGKLVKTLVGGQTAANFEKAITAYLK